MEGNGIAINMNQIKISNHQLKTITLSFVCGSTTLVAASSSAKIAKQDAWISAIIAAILGMIVVWVDTYLGSLYPGKTYFQVIKVLLGNWIGGVVCINVILLSFITATQVVWYVKDFFATTYMIETPGYAIETLFIVVIVIALRYGLEAMARASEVFCYIIVFMFLVSMLLLFPNVDIKNLLPILENGIVPSIKGSLTLISFSGLPLILLNTIYPLNIDNIKGAKKAIFNGYLQGMLILIVSVLMCILVLGSDITATARFPVFLVTKEINVAVVFSRLEALIVIVWLLTIFNSALFYFYAGFIGLSEVLDLKNRKVIILPLGLIITIFSDFIYLNVPYEMWWDTMVWPPYIFTFGFILPVILLLISLIKRLLAKSGFKA